MYLLPSTCYDGGRTDRLISLHPGGCAHARQESKASIDPPRISYTPTERPITFTFANESPFDTRSRTESTSSINTNILDEIDDAIDQVFSYTAPSRAPAQDAQTAPMILPATTYEAPSSSNEMLLPALKYDSSAPSSSTKDPLLPATKYTSPSSSPSSAKDVVLPATKYELAKEVVLPATKYEPEPPKQVVLPSTTYSPQTQRGRKDSVVPWTDKELPPVPIDG
jgi:hypothetical protein